MAIVFISPKQNQKLFFGAATLLLILFLAIISLAVLLPEFANKNKSIPVTTVSTDPRLSLDLSNINSPEVKNLEPFSSIETNFAYVATDQNGNQVSGDILASDSTTAQTLLKNVGLTVLSLQLANIGRSQPFVSY